MFISPLSRVTVLARRLAVIAMIVAGLALVTSPPAVAGPLILPGGNPVGANLLAQWWSRIFSLPVASNPLFGAGDPCQRIAGGTILAPVVGPGTPGGFTCTVRAGTPVFLVGFSSACDQLETPFPVGAAAQRQCAEQFDVSANVVSTSYSIDGAPPVELHARAFEAVTTQRTAQLPPDNLAGVDPGPDPYVAHGWTALAVFLAPGRHTIRHDVESDFFTGATTYDVVLTSRP